MPDALKELVDAVTRYTTARPGGSPFVTDVAGLTIVRSDRETRPSYRILTPAVCLVVQGAKSTTFGATRFDYRAGQALVVGVDMPVVSRITEASPRAPYLAVVLELDPGVMRDVLEELDAPPAAGGPAEFGAFVAGGAGPDGAGPLADCALRAVRLLDTPRAIPVLYPAILREVCYWLLTGPHGGAVARMTVATPHTPRVVRAVHALRDRFAEPVRVDELAAIAHLSPSAFHRQFKALTSMTPLQYQKQLRLMEARRLMVSSAANVEAAAFQVGYESPSQFSREYARRFGRPPRRDVAARRPGRPSRARVRRG